MYDSTEKDKQKLVNITWRHSPSWADRKKNNYQIHVRIFDHSTPEDMLLWYSKIQDIFVKKPCDDAETKFNITELLRTGQAKKFLQFKKEIMTKDPETGLEIDRGVTDETFQETLKKLEIFLLRKELPSTKYSI